MTFELCCVVFQMADSLQEQVTALKHLIKAARQQSETSTAAALERQRQQWEKEKAEVGYVTLVCVSVVKWGSNCLSRLGIARRSNKIRRNRAQNYFVHRQNCHTQIITRQNIILLF